MSTWREITEDDLRGVLNEAEYSAYQSAVTGDGQDPAADAIAAAVGQARGYIAASPQNTLEAGLTLPARCILAVCHIIRVELLTRLDLEVSEPRMAAKRDAIQFLRDVAAGKVAVEDPTGDGTESFATPRPIVTARTRTFSRAAQEGI
jgi:phage gp36-like protein